MKDIVKEGFSLIPARLVPETGDARDNPNAAMISALSIRTEEYNSFSGAV